MLRILLSVLVTLCLRAAPLDLGAYSIDYDYYAVRDSNVSYSVDFYINSSFDLATNGTLEICFSRYISGNCAQSNEYRVSIPRKSSKKFSMTFPPKSEYSGATLTFTGDQGAVANLSFSAVLFSGSQSIVVNAKNQDNRATAKYTTPIIRYVSMEGVRYGLKETYTLTYASLLNIARYINIKGFNLSYKMDNDPSGRRNVTALYAYEYNNFSIEGVFDTSIYTFKTGNNATFVSEEYLLYNSLGKGYKVDQYGTSYTYQRVMIPESYYGKNINVYFNFLSLGAYGLNIKFNFNFKVTETIVNECLSGADSLYCLTSTTPSTTALETEHINTFTMTIGE